MEVEFLISFVLERRGCIMMYQIQSLLMGIATIFIVVIDLMAE